MNYWIILSCCRERSPAFTVCWSWFPGEGYCTRILLAIFLQATLLRSSFRKTLAIFFQENAGHILSGKPLFETLTRRSLTILLWGNMKTSGSTRQDSGNILSEKALFETKRRPLTILFQENFFLRQQKDFWQYSLHCNEWPWNIGAVFLKQKSLPLLACNFICSCWPDSPATMLAHYSMRL